MLTNYPATMPTFGSTRVLVTAGRLAMRDVVVMMVGLRSRARRFEP